MNVFTFAPIGRAFAAMGAIFFLLPIAAPGAGALDTNGIQSAIGFSGKTLPGGVFRVSIPRGDLHVSINGVPLKTALALGGYAVYEATPEGALVMGDLPLLQAEVPAVQRELLGAGFDITALHNHLLNDTPHVMYMHYMKTGDAVAISRQLHQALMHTGVSFVQSAAAATPFPDPARIDAALGLKGMAHDGIYSVSLPRPEKIVEHGTLLPAGMGVATSINFQTAGRDAIASTGDFVLTADEVQPVARALASHGIEVTALHQHLVGADPMLYFMHFWAAGPPAAVLPGLRAAVDVLRQKP